MALSPAAARARLSSSRNCAGARAWKSEGRPSAGAKHVARLPHWPASANATMRLGLVPTVAHGALRADICAFWDAYHPVPYHSQDERKEASAAFEQR